MANKKVIKDKNINTDNQINNRDGIKTEKKLVDKKNKIVRTRMQNKVDTTVAICDRKYDNSKYGALLKRYFAHRGVHKNFPENSIPAFNEAIKLNMAIEIDVHLSKDNQLVVFHDDSLVRMTGEKNYVRFLTLEELKLLRLNNTECTIPTLNGTLNFVGGRTPILLEIKTEHNTKRICQKVINELKEYKGDVFIQSFNPFALRYFYKHAPNYLRGQLSSFFIGQKLAPIKRFIIKTLRLNKYAHIDFVAYNIKNLPNKYVLKTRVPVLTYSIKTKEEYNKGKVSSNNLIIDNVDVLEN